MSAEYLADARFGKVRSIRMLRPRPPLSYEHVGSSVGALLCQAPARRGFDPTGPVTACPNKARWCYRIERMIVPLCRMHATAAERAGEVLVVAGVEP